MFGYLKPFNEELKVKNLTLYNATYCGLCKTISHNFSNAMSLFLSYDYVFLTLLRSAVNKSKYETSKKRCIIHPFKKKLMIETNPDLSYTANISILMSYFKIIDNINDKPAISKIKYKFLKPLVESNYKKVSIDNDTKDKISSLFTEISNIEKRKGELDELSAKFGKIMSIIFSYGINDEMNCKVLQEIGYNIGKYIYYCDVTEDIFEDSKTGNYNPLLQDYELSKIYDKKEKHISDNALKSLLYSSTILTLENAAKAIELIDFSENRDIEEIIKNTIYLGLPNQYKAILNYNRE